MLKTVDLYSSSQPTDRTAIEEVAANIRCCGAGKGSVASRRSCGE